MLLTRERHAFSLTDKEILELARYAVIIEQHYGRPMDIEWGKDGDGAIYILQARPETVKSQSNADTQQRFRLTGNGDVLVTGRAIGQKIGIGPVRIIKDVAQMEQVQPGDVLVTDMTDPNWEPVMKRAAAIVTNRGGRTCHAAIIARELGIPAVVGCDTATDDLAEGDVVTVSCAEGDTGNVYAGALEMEVETVQRGALPPIPVKIMMNIGNPQLAFEFQSLPNAGVGLARLEFIINNVIGVHPKAVLDYPNLDAGTEAGGRRPRARLPESARVLRNETRRGHFDDRCCVLAEAGHRAHVGLQEQRVQEADRRLALRARRRKSDARLSRRFALHRRFVSRVLSNGSRRAEESARRDGAHQRRDHGAVRAHADRGEARDRTAGSARAEARNGWLD